MCSPGQPPSPTSTAVTAALNNIFEREHTLSLDRLKTIPKKEARQFLRELPDIHPFVEAYVLLYALEGQAIPVDEEILALLRDHNIVDATSTIEEAQKFLESSIKAEDCHDFYTAVRNHLSERARKAKKA